MRVFVTVGNSLDPFDRLIEMVDESLPDGPVDGLCQYGSSTVRPSRMSSRSHLTRPEFENEIVAADVIVCHGGVGTIWSAVREGHAPLVVPRRVALREHVNDHQLEIVRELAAAGKIVAVEGPADLRRWLERFQAGEVVRERPMTQNVQGLRPFGSAINVHRRRLPGMLEEGVLRLLSSLAPPLAKLRIK